MEFLIDFLKYNFHKKVIIFNIYDTFLINTFSKTFHFLTNGGTGKLTPFIYTHASGKGIKENIGDMYMTELNN